MSEGQFSLEEKLRQAQQAAQRKEGERKQAEEEARYVEMRNQIAQLQEKRQTLEMLVEQLKSGYAETTKAIEDLRPKKQKADELYMAYTALLEHDFGKEAVQETFGINPAEISTKRDFVRALSDSQESAQYQESVKAVREKAQGVHRIKKQLLGEIPQEGGTPISKRVQIIEAAQNRITALDAEINILQEKIPEGRQEIARKKEETLKERVFALHQGMHYITTDFFKEIERRKIEQWNFIGHKDIESVEKGEGEQYKEAVKEYYYGKIDEGMERNKKEEGLDEVSEDLEYMKDYLESSRIAERMADTVSWQRKQLQENMLRTQYGDQWERYGRSIILEEVIGNMALFRDVQGDPIQLLNSDSIEMQKQADVVRNFWEGQTNSLLPQFLRPERIIAYARRLDNAMGQISETINLTPEVLTTEEFLHSCDDVGKDITDQEKKRYWTPSDRIRGWVKNKAASFNFQNKPEQVLKRREQEFTAEAQQKKDLVSIRIDMEWAEQREENFRNQPVMNEILKEHQQLEDQKREAERIPSFLVSSRSFFDRGLDQKVVIRRDEGYQFIELEPLKQKLKERDEELEKEEEDLKELEKQVREKWSENRGWFGWKKKRILREHEALSENEAQLRNKVGRFGKQLRDEHNFYSELMKKIDLLIKVLDLTELISGKEIAVGEILGLVSSRIKEIKGRQLSPEKQVLYDEYSGLLRESEEVKKRYKKLMGW